jgi:hypothetical protein
MEEDFKKRLLKVKRLLFYVVLVCVTVSCLSCMYVYIYAYTCGHFLQAKAYVNMLQEREQKQEKAHQQEVCLYGAIYIYIYIPCRAAMGGG